MIIDSTTHLLLPLLALSLTLAMAALVCAQDRHDRGPDNASVTLQVTFGNTPGGSHHHPGLTALCQALAW